jgi:hypothetical protein
MQDLYPASDRDRTETILAVMKTRFQVVHVLGVPRYAGPLTERS